MSYRTTVATRSLCLERRKLVIPLLEELVLPQGLTSQRKIKSPCAERYVEQHDDQTRRGIPVGEIECEGDVGQHIRGKAADSQQDQSKTHESDGGNNVNRQPHDGVRDNVIADENSGHNVEQDE